MKFENTEVWGFKHALRGMRNPLNSWDKSDSRYATKLDCQTIQGMKESIYIIGEGDMRLAKKLIAGGSEHRKFLRQIMVSVDIAAPLFWFKEFDTYKVGTTANSTSSMHTLSKDPITKDCFELDDVDDIYMKFFFNEVIDKLEAMRITYNQFRNIGEVDKAREAWKALVAALPESWLQTRTVTMNYENLFNMYHQRSHHKLKQWSEDFCNWVKTLPYAKEFICGEDDE